jgi:hypothetical protein
MANQYDIGDVVRCKVNIKDLSDVDIDPTALNFRFKTPSGQETEYKYGVSPELVQESVGNYYVDVPIYEHGRFYYRFWSTGIGQGAVRGHFYVNKNDF